MSLILSTNSASDGSNRRKPETLSGYPTTKRRSEIYIVGMRVYRVAKAQHRSAFFLKIHVSCYCSEITPYELDGARHF